MPVNNERTWHTRTSKQQTMNDRRLQQDENISQVLRNTLRYYGSIFLVFLLSFCFLRRRYPRAYNLRTWVEEIQCKLAEEQYGFISWAWQLWWLSDDDILDQCGMDSLCYIRVLLLGLKMSMIGMINAIWLMPLYGTAKQSQSGITTITDPVAQLSIANLPDGSYRLVGTVVATYAIFGYVMYLLLQEMKWFTQVRHQFLSKPEPRNYAVYVRGIPEEYRSSAELLAYFRQCFSMDSVLEAHVALHIPNLAKKVDERATVVAKLEHIINVEEIKKSKSTRTVNGVSRSTSDILIEKLAQLNREIKDEIEQIEATRDTKSYVADLEDHYVALQQNAMESSTTSEQSSLTGSLLSKRNHSVKPSENNSNESVDKLDISTTDTRRCRDTVAQRQDQNIGSSRRLLNDLTKPVKLVATQGKKAAASAKHVATSAAAKLLKPEDGQPREAGFVVFSSLRTTQAALQIIHHPTPFQMQALEAPNPDGKASDDMRSQCSSFSHCCLWGVDRCRCHLE